MDGAMLYGSQLSHFTSGSNRLTSVNKSIIADDPGLKTMAKDKFYIEAQGILSLEPDQPRISIIVALRHSQRAIISRALLTLEEKGVIRVPGSVYRRVASTTMRKLHCDVWQWFCRCII